MSEFNLSDDDVVSMNLHVSLVGNQTFKVSQFMHWFKQKVGGSAEVWTGEGVDCEVLISSTGGGWQPGKVRIRLEFVPDEPELDDEPEPLYLEGQLSIEE
ncbi:hypothetical protein H6F74_09570 [Trichocoleus sp. FACHB-90]|uniref:KGK domain-containing protein n=1 Tax=Cyanophyceae TaxID=3028117 RepID=UPI00168634E3|nr:KGK domain-containing protein [Trichocoleus sp. FACHB-90]MBD1926490.1 hypothetical protein [Trichocoleus sp. FACHB-90]